MLIYRCGSDVDLVKNTRLFFRLILIYPHRAYNLHIIFDGFDKIILLLLYTSGGHPHAAVIVGRILSRQRRKRYQCGVYFYCWRTCTYTSRAHAYIILYFIYYIFAQRISHAERVRAIFGCFFCCCCKHPIVLIAKTRRKNNNVYGLHVGFRRNV